MSHTQSRWDDRRGPVVRVVLPFEEVYRRHSGRVLLFCRMQVNASADAEDLAADVFEAAYVAYQATRPTAEGVLPWLLTIARNAAIDRYRKQRRRSGILARFAARDDEAARGRSVEDEAITRAEVRNVLACARDLAPRDRILIGLRVVAGLSHAEVAEVLGISPRAAAVACQRAVNRLRTRYEATP